MADFGWANGDHGTVLDLRWREQDDSLTLELSLKRDGEQHDFGDYGSDTAIDPELRVGEEAVSKMDLYARCWVSRSTYMSSAKYKKAVHRVIYNRHYRQAYKLARQGHNFRPTEWFEALVARTGIPVVMANGKRLEGRQLAGGHVLCSDRHFRYLMEDPKRLHELSDIQFQHLVADRLFAAGLEVRPVGPTRAADGGVDLVAWPRSRSLPYLAAVQVKHYDKPGTLTPVGDVRELLGVITSTQSCFQFGVLVTSTGFTSQAASLGSENRRLIRLRGRADVLRWIRGDFAAADEWREVSGPVKLGQSLIKMPADRRWWKFALKAEIVDHLSSQVARVVENIDGKKYQVELQLPEGMFAPDGSLNTGSPHVQIADSSTSTLGLAPFKSPSTAGAAREPCSVDVASGNLKTNRRRRRPGSSA